MTVSVHRKPQPIISGFAFPAVILVALLVSRLQGSYAAAWAIGVLGFLFILAFGRPIERVLLLSLGCLSLLAGGEQMALGLRATLIAATFVFLARYVAINPWLHLVAQLSALGFATLASGATSLELFVYAPSILFLILSSELARDAAIRGNPLGRVISPIFNMSALAMSALGQGSRSALFVWLVENMRRLTLSRLILLGTIIMLTVPILLVLRELPLVQKLSSSIAEIAEPVDLETGAISQRGIENLTFIGYAATATSREILIGSTEPIMLDGPLLARDADVKFIPHNQLFGMIFQFGILGTSILAIYLFSLIQYFSVDRLCLFLLIALLLPGFLLKHGFIDTDLAMLVATLNWIRRRHPERLSNVPC